MRLGETEDWRLHSASLQLTLRLLMSYIYIWSAYS